MLNHGATPEYKSWLRPWFQGCVVVYECGLLVVYMIIIGDVLAGTWSDGSHHVGLMKEWFGQQWWSTRFTLLLLTIILVFAPLISFKRIDSLRYTSALSVGLAIVFVVITAGIAIVKLEEGSVQMPPLWPKLVGQASFWQLFTTIPVLVTAYICHHNSATATVSVGFIFPAAVAFRDRHNIAMKKDRLISMVMIFLAVSSSSVAILSDIYSIFTAKNSEVDYLLAKHHRSWNSANS
ncbi:hypothetical protein Droror1_Dr00016154 [Drosera rotundifolia]